MGWTYRIGKKTYPVGGVYFGVCEIYLDADGKIEGWSQPVMRAGGETLEEVRSDLGRMLAVAVVEEVVDLDTIKAGDRLGKV